MEKRVLLIDCDLRRPNVHNIFKLDNKKGLTNVIGKMIEIDEAVKHDVLPNLDILPEKKSCEDQGTDSWWLHRPNGFTWDADDHRQLYESCLDRTGKHAHDRGTENRMQSLSQPVQRVNLLIW